MKLFTLLASAVGLAHAAEDVPEAADAWQSASSADKRIWKSDVLHAQGTMKQIKNKSCKLPKGKSLSKLGDPRQVSKHYYRLSNGNYRATYQFKFGDGTMVYAGNSNVGQKGGNWRVYCYRQGHSTATHSSHSQSDLSRTMIGKLRSVFKRIDKDGSGTITTGGAYTGLAQIFPSYSLPNYEATLEKESIRAAGKDKVVDLDEFECVAKKLYNIKKVYDEFRSYDRNHDLKMSRKELENALIKFYFKDVAKNPSLLRSAAAKAKAKKLVDAIIKRHDKNHDSQVSWNEFEMDAFNEEHYSLGAKCRTSKTPLNSHEVKVVENLIKKFHGNTHSKKMSHSMWYQITSMLTEQAIDAVNGPAKGPALGCWHHKPTKNNNNKPGGNNNQHGGFGQNGGRNFGYTKRPYNGNPRVVGGRVLLERMLQSGRGPTRVRGQTNKQSSGAAKQRMSVMQAVQALHKQADRNHDGQISDHEILDIFQGVRNHLSQSDFGGFLDMVNRLHGPVKCGAAKSCGSCTAVKNAGLCGWFGESQSRSNNPFGGYTQKSKGNCKFVDRSNNSEQHTDALKLTTCSNQCKKKKTNNNKYPWQRNNNNRGNTGNNRNPRNRGNTGNNRGNTGFGPRN